MGIAACQHPSFLPTPLGDGHGELFFNLNFLLLKSNQLLIQSVVFSQFLITQNFLPVEASQYRHRGNVIINEQTRIDVLSARSLFAVNRYRVTARLQNIKRGFGNIDINISSDMASKLPNLFPVQIDFGILIMMNAQG